MENKEIFYHCKIVIFLFCFARFALADFDAVISSMILFEVMVEDKFVKKIRGVQKLIKVFDDILYMHVPQREQGKLVYVVSKKQVMLICKKGCKRCMHASSCSFQKLQEQIRPTH